MTFHNRMALLQHIVLSAESKDDSSTTGVYEINDDRSGTGTWNMSGVSIKYHLLHGQIPFEFARPMPKRLYVEELNWFLQGKESTDYLEEKKVPFWKQWTAVKDNGVSSIGPMYPIQWRNKKVYVGQDIRGFHPDGQYILGENRFGNIDQIQHVVELLKHNPSSRRIYISNLDQGLHPVPAISPTDNVRMGNMALDPCHCFFQLLVRDATPMEMRFISGYEIRRKKHLPDSKDRPLPTKVIDGILTMRSNDLPVGAPANIFQYCLLMHYLAHVCGYHVGNYTHNVGSAHIYKSQMQGVKEELAHYHKVKTEAESVGSMYLTDNLTEEAFLSGRINPDDVVFSNNFTNSISIKYPLEG